MFCMVPKVGSGMKLRKVHQIILSQDSKEQMDLLKHEFSFCTVIKFLVSNEFHQMIFLIV